MCNDYESEIVSHMLLLVACFQGKPSRGYVK
jgi:hypothetical protein